LFIALIQQAADLWKNAASATKRRRNKHSHFEPLFSIKTPLSKGSGVFVISSYLSSYNPGTANLSQGPIFLHPAHHPWLKVFGE